MRTTNLDPFEVYKDGESDHPECPKNYILAGLVDRGTAGFSFWKSKKIGKPFVSQRKAYVPLFVLKSEWDQLASSVKLSKPKAKTPTKLTWKNGESEIFCVDTAKALRLVDSTNDIALGEDFPRNKDVELIRAHCREKSEPWLVLKSLFPEKVLGYPEEKWEALNRKGEVYLRKTNT